MNTYSNISLQVMNTRLYNKYICVSKLRKMKEKQSLVYLDDADHKKI